MDAFDFLIDERGSLVSQLAFTLGGDRDMAEDLAQETLLRAWQRLPAGLTGEQRRAWVRRTGKNLAIDELRRRRRWLQAPTDDAEAGLGVLEAAGEVDAAREALDLLSAHERFILLLRFDAGFAYDEIARLLEIGEEAARKRVTRARASFLRVYRRVSHAGSDPLVLLVIREDQPEPYVQWLEAAGARVRRVDGRIAERDLALSDAVVFTGSQIDLHPSLYGEPSRWAQGDPDPVRDRRDLAAMDTALALDLPILGICRGGQLLNIASGGSLYQDVVDDGLTRVRHDAGLHSVRTADGHVRRLLGSSAEVHSEHHQAVRRLGRRLRVTAVSPDEVVETIERDDKRFALGLQWHPEITVDGPGALVAEALVEATRAAA